MENVKVVYSDNKAEKVIKGILINEDEFTYTIQCEDYIKPIVIGKRSLIKLTYITESVK